MQGLKATSISTQLHHWPAAQPPPALLTEHGPSEHVFALCPGAGLWAAHVQQRAHSLPQHPLASSAVAGSGRPRSSQQRRLQRLAQPKRQKHLHSMT